MDLTGHLLVWGPIAGAVGTAYVATKRVAIKVRRFWIRGRAEYDRYVLAIERVDTIHKQVLPNGGTSMSDRLDKMSLRGARVAAMLETLADISDVPQFRTDELGDYNYVNRAFLALTGRQFDRLRGPNALNAIAPGDRQRVSDEWEASIEQERDFESDYRIIGAGGESIPVRCLAQVFRDEATSRFLGYTGRLEDLRKHAKPAE